MKVTDLTANLINIRIVTAIFSLLLSLFAFYTDDIINRDGVMYMDMAEAFLSGGLVATAKIYNWPFFSVLVAFTHQITGFTLEYSACILNSLLFVLLTDILILLSNKLLPNTRQLSIAAILILCFPAINEYRDFIIRDIGYWTFCSLALYRFILYIDTPTIKNATFWQITAVIAILFRIEGAIILLALPLFILMTRQPVTQRLLQLVQLNYLLISGLVIASTLAIGQIGFTQAFGKLATVTAYANTDALIATFNKKTVILETRILNRFSADYSSLILISGFLVMLFYKLTKALSLGYIALYIASWWKKQPPNNHPYFGLLLYFSVINLVILVTFIAKQYFIVDRYTVMMLISLLLLMLPRLCQIIESIWLSQNKKLKYFVCLVLLLTLVDSVTHSNSKSYIKDTAIWASQNLPIESTVLTNDEFIRYYFHSHQGKSTLIEGNINHYKKYDYLIVVEKRRNLKLKDQLKTLTIESIFSIEGKRENQASIYKVIY